MRNSSEKNPTQLKQHIIVLGGGVCGLYAALTALRNGYAVTILEKRDKLGGLAATHHANGNNFDLGVHMLHAFDKEIFTDIAQLMGDKRIEVPLDARIRWQKSTYRYPLQFSDLIREMPWFILFKGVVGLVIAELRRSIKPKESANAQDALIQFYGKPLYNYFFEDFTHRYWGIHPKELSAEFVKRKLPRLSAVDFIRKQLGKILPIQENLTTESSLLEETLHYSVNGSGQMIASLYEEIIKLGGVVKTGVTISAISFNKPSVVLANEDVKGDYLINTIPLGAFINLCDDVPQSVKNAADKLRYKPIAIYGLVVKKKRAIDGLYIYFRDRVFHRVGEPKNAGLHVNNEEHTTLIIETTCEVNDPRWNGLDSFREQITKDLAAEGICETKDILEWHTMTYAHGYPIYDLGYEQHLTCVEHYIDKAKLIKSTGRQGGFTYPAMHTAMKMGREAVLDILNNK